jgi:hypothetical protein
MKPNGPPSRQAGACDQRGYGSQLFVKQASIRYAGSGAYRDWAAVLSSRANSKSKEKKSGAVTLRPPDHVPAIAFGRARILLPRDGPRLAPCGPHANEKPR